MAQASGVELASRMDAIQDVSIELPLEPESAARARAAISELGGDAAASSLDDVRLMVSELVADALATEPRPADAAFNVEAQALDGAPRVTVTFDGLALRIPAETPQPAELGWGVYLVKTLANR